MLMCGSRGSVTDPNIVTVVVTSMKLVLSWRSWDLQHGVEKSLVPLPRYQEPCTPMSSQHLGV